MPERVPILFVDDEAPMRQAVTQWLELAGFELMVHEDASSAAAKLSAGFPGIVVTDLKMEGMDGLALLRRAQEADPELPVVVITGHGDVQIAVEAMRLGAYDFIEKPFVPERFLEVVRHASEKRQLVIENRRLRRAVNDQALTSRIVGTSKAAENLRGAVADLAGTDVSVILYGETGVGKDLVARCLHDFGKRQKGNYVAINCAAIPETMVESEFFGHEAGAFTSAVKSRPGKIEHASGGTLFLDEIDSMPQATQGKLLRVLQERSVERLGSNQSIAVDLRAVAHKRELRPLSAATMNLLMAQEWPGNVRELRNTAERYALGLGGFAPRAHQEKGKLSLAEQVDAFERAVIERSLAESGGKISSVMEQLDIPRRTLSEKMVRLGLDRQRFLEPDRQNSANESEAVGGKLLKP